MTAAQSWILPGRRPLTLATPAALAGIINTTPDSFSDGGRYPAADAAIAAGMAMVAAGATWLDVGGESSRPGATPITAAAEISRVIPVIAGLRRRLDAAGNANIALSIDTTKAMVARAALAAGADAVNDISAGADPGMFAAVATHRAAIVLMHMQGTPATMQAAPTYADVVAEVIAFLHARLQAAVAANVPADMVIVDPGIGFGKTPAHNVALLEALPRIAEEVGRPLLVGLSRKKFLSTLNGSHEAAGERDVLSHAWHARIARHCALLRVHDVAGARAAIAGADSTVVGAPSAPVQEKTVAPAPAPVQALAHIPAPATPATFTPTNRTARSISPTLAKLAAAGLSSGRSPGGPHV
jgi:dihydropteroate synthase